MKVLYIANRKDVTGGGQISLIGLVSALEKSGIELYVLCPGDGTMADRFSSTGAEVIKWDMPSPKSPRLLRTLDKFVELRAIIEDTGADIVHTNGSRAQFYASQAVKGTKAKLVWHVRVSFRDKPFYDGFLYRRADRVICASAGIALSKFCAFPDEDGRIEVVHNAVDISEFLPGKGPDGTKRRIPGVPDGGLLIGSAGAVEPNKGYDVLIEAFSEVAGRHPATLVIAGWEKRPRYSRMLRRLAAEKGVEGRVIFRGYVEDMAGFYVGLDIFVLPSFSEGFSRALIEAMSCALPVVATDIPGNREAVTTDVTGLLVPPGDHDAMSKAIEKFYLDAGLAARCGRSARRRVEESFSIEQHAAKITAVYRELMA